MKNYNFFKILIRDFTKQFFWPSRYNFSGMEGLTTKFQSAMNRLLRLFLQFCKAK